jgi:uncharacterized RDD family membrane protein YckC
VPTEPLKEPAAAPGLARRLAAALYDAIALAGVLVVMTALAIIPLGVAMDYRVPPDSLWFRLYLLAVIVAFFVWPWLRGGQTLGMRTWGMRVVRADGGKLRLRDALLRLAAACLSWTALGVGFLWVVVDRENLAWHDRLSATRLILVGGSSSRDAEKQ